MISNPDKCVKYKSYVLIDGALHSMICPSKEKVIDLESLVVYDETSVLHFILIVWYVDRLI